MTTLRGAVKDSGAFDVTLEEGEQGDEQGDLRDASRPSTKISNKKCHQGTQTEFLRFLTVHDFTVHEPIEDTHL